MSSKYKVADDSQPHFLTFTVLQWIDVFSRECYRETLLESLTYCIANKGLRLHAWVIMSNHIHLVASMKDGHSMSGFVRDFKKFTAKKIVSAVNSNPAESRREWMMRAFSRAGQFNNNNEIVQFWEQDYHPIVLSTPGRLAQRMAYLHQNPVRAGIVWEPQDYKYSSAGDYILGKEGLLPLVKLEVHGVVLW